MYKAGSVWSTTMGHVGPPQFPGYAGYQVRAFEVLAAQTVDGLEAAPVQQSTSGYAHSVEQLGVAYPSNWRFWRINDGTRQMVASKDPDTVLMRPVVARYSPPIGFPVALTQGQEYAVTTEVRTAVAAAPGASLAETEPAPPRSATYRMTYLGRETVTVPAGTFETCRFRLPYDNMSYVPTADGSVVQEWVVASGVYRGVTVKTSANHSPSGDPAQATVWEALRVTAEFK